VHIYRIKNISLNFPWEITTVFYKKMLFQTFIVFYVLCLSFTVFIISAADFMKILEFYIEIATLQLFSSLILLFYNYLSEKIILHKVHYV